MNRRLLSLLLSLVVLGALVSACGGNESETTAQQGQPAALQAPAGAVVGATVPDFALQRLDGSTLTLSELRGKAVMIDFWDTWCPPCRAAMPHLQEISEAYKGDLVIVGVAFGRQGKDAVAKFVQENGLTFEFVLANQKVLTDFGGLPSIPTTFLVDRDGKVVKKWVGGQDKEIYEAAVRSAVAS